MEKHLPLKMSFLNGTFDKNPHDTDIAQVYGIITGTMLKNDTVKYRSLKASGYPDQHIKQRMAAVTPAVTCSGGHGADKIQGYTGMSMCDFDHVASPETCMRLLRADKHTLLAYTTLSGSGIRVLFRYAVDGVPLSRITTKEYAAAFHAGNEHFALLLGTDYDDKCKNPNRLSVICHDPDAYFNPDAEPIYCSAGGVMQGRGTGGSHAPQQPVTAEEAAARAEEILASKGVVYAEGNRNCYIMNTGYMLNKMGIPLAGAQQWAASRFADYGVKDVERIMCSCYTHTSEHGTWQPRPSPSRGGKKTLRDVRSQHEERTHKRVTKAKEKEDFIRKHAGIRYNTVTRRIEIKWNGEENFRNITDRDENTLWLMMDDNGFVTSPKEIHNIIASNHTPSVNPFALYFGTLGPWDGKTDHIARLAGHVHITCANPLAKDAAQRRFVYMFRMWLTGMVASLLSDTAVNHEVLALIGEQGIYKSTFFERLLPPELRIYFNERGSNNMTDKDSVLAVSQYAMICLSEIDCMNRKELNALKTLTTMQRTNERAPYDRYPEERKRIASFCATGNNREFLSDDTGNRRWMAFEVEAIDNPRQIDYCYEGLYAQALHQWKNGFRFWMTDEENRELTSQNRWFEAPNVTIDLIMKYFRKPQPHETAELVTTGEVVERITCNYRGKINGTKVGVAMKRLDVEKVRLRDRTFYKLISLTPDEYNRKRYDDGGDGTDSGGTTADAPF